MEKKYKKSSKMVAKDIKAFLCLNNNSRLSIENIIIKFEKQFAIIFRYI